MWKSQAIYGNAIFKSVCSAFDSLLFFYTDFDQLNWLFLPPDLCQHWSSVWAEPTESTLLLSNARKQSHLFTKCFHIWSKTEEGNTTEWPQKQIHKDMMSATQLCTARMVLWSRQSWTPSLAQLARRCWRIQCKWLHVAIGSARGASVHSLVEGKQCK